MNNLIVPSVFRRMDSLFNDTFPNARRSYLGLDFSSINVKDKHDHYEMTMALPGCEDKDVKVEIKGSTLFIKASGESETKTEENEYLVREFSQAEVERSFTLPRDVDADKIEAKMDKGVLHLSLPKTGSLSQSKTIEVKKAK